MLKFKDLSDEEKTKRGILGTLFGPIASVVKSTRNGRKYPDEVWEKAFNDPLVKEMLAAGGIPGELDHPTDRSETCSEKIAIMMPEAPKKDKDGHLVARFDIIDTPMGRIAAALVKYGFKFGISSRGSGDTFTDYDGEETVDADTYEFQAFDLVLLPACEDARLRLAESFDVKKLKFRKELKEAFENATDEQKKIMMDTLNNLDIDYTSEKSVNKDDNSDTDKAAEDNGAKMLQEFQESIKAQQELEGIVQSLQEKLSVCYTKETRYVEALSRAKDENARLKSDNNKLKAEIGTLTESLTAEKNNATAFNEKVASMRTTIKSAKGEVTSLTESVSAKNAEIKRLKGEMASLKETYTKRCNILKGENTSLQEKLVEAQKDSRIVQSQSVAKVTKAQELVEKYKSIAKTAIEKYISSQATRLGISPDEIKRNLNENYSFNDIDRVCESLQQYKLNVNSLPFDISRTKSQMRVSIKESKEPIKRGEDGSDLFDDGVDSMLQGFM